MAAERQQHLRPVYGADGSVIQIVDERSAALRAEFFHAAQSEAMRRSFAARAQLPVAFKAGEILAAVLQHQVVVLSGDTGSGKTTQVPQMILEDAVRRGLGCETDILVTQPRRLAATSVARRVAEERCEALGRHVGYAVRFDSVDVPSGVGRIRFCTTGHVLRRLFSDPELSGVSHIIVDEVHERDINTDYLLLFLRQLLARPNRRHLRLILMSATLDAEQLAAYFRRVGRSGSSSTSTSTSSSGMPLPPLPPAAAAADDDKRDASTSTATVPQDDERHTKDEEEQEEEKARARYRYLTPCKIKVHGRTFPVRPVFLRHLVNMTRRLGLYKGPIPAPLAARLAHQKEQQQRWKYQHRGQETGGDTWIDARDPVPYALLVASIELLHLRMYDAPPSPSASASRGHHNGHRNGHRNGQRNHHQQNHHGRGTQRRGGRGGGDEGFTFAGPGAILVFLPGWQDIDTVAKALARSRHLDPARVRVHTLHSQLPALHQQGVFEIPPPGVTKIVLATNIAESSLTIPDVVYVIDSGLRKQREYDPTTKTAALETVAVSQRSITQRQGRAGRVAPGMAIRLFSSDDSRSLPQSLQPEICRVPLTEVCLLTKLLPPLAGGEGARDADENMCLDVLPKALTAPDTAAVHAALAQLRQLGCLDEFERLTPLGKMVAHMPLPPRQAKMLCLASVLGCAPAAATLAAALQRDPFVMVPPHQREEALAARQRLGGGLLSDHVVLVSAYEAWLQACSEDRQRAKQQQQKKKKKKEPSVARVELLACAMRAAGKSMTENGNDAKKDEKKEDDEEGEVASKDGADSTADSTGKEEGFAVAEATDKDVDEDDDTSMSPGDAFCVAHFLSPRSMHHMRKVRKQLLQELRKQGLPTTGVGARHDENRAMLKAAVVASLQPNLLQFKEAALMQAKVGSSKSKSKSGAAAAAADEAAAVEGKRFKFCNRCDCTISLHPSSVAAYNKQAPAVPPCPTVPAPAPAPASSSSSTLAATSSSAYAYSWAVFEQRVRTSSVFMRGASAVTSEALLLLADDVKPWCPTRMNRAGRIGLLIHGWAVLCLDRRVAGPLLAFRETLRTMIEARILNPRAEPPASVLAVMDACAEYLREAERRCSPHALGLRVAKEKQEEEEKEEEAAAAAGEDGGGAVGGGEGEQEERNLKLDDKQMVVQAEKEKRGGRTKGGQSSAMMMMMVPRQAMRSRQ